MMAQQVKINDTQQAYEDIRRIAATMEIGEQLNGELCPFCAGGDKGERSLNLERTKTVVKFRCHRDSCARKSIINLGSYEPQVLALPKPEKKKDPMEKMVVTALPFEIRARMRKDYHLLDWDFDTSAVKWIKNWKRLYLPIFAMASKRMTPMIGCVAKSIDGALPKNLTILNDPRAPCASFYESQGNNPYNTVMLVEDQLSAVKASRYVTSIALLGTYLPDSVVADLLSAGTQTIYIALDRDATETAIQIKREIGEIFKSVIVKHLPGDIKNMAPEETRIFMLGE